ncbi:RNA 2',3'-cyclic phosphodiesterase [Alkalibacillus aidingensis]|uniref:RNA 2',3'-cyclic phosphodiesterase n=1 Tax=Alkalibacillus aidingensis TaxID=2747607 RepID=UPI001660EC1E|nr:RNA 2',3'-cyclic phosphodiesterase [Alkalibacillus aidingensis]
MTNLPHYFIGIPVPTKVAEELIDWQERLKPHVDYRIWVAKADFHITLKFLGPCSDEKIDQLTKSILNLDLPESFDLKVDGIRFFGKKIQPRVTYAHVEGHPRLDLIKQLIEKSAVKNGFEMENRPYRPHITLAKKWKDQSMSLTNPLSSELISRGSVYRFSVDHFNIYQINLNQKPKYQVIQSFQLKT